MMELLSPAVERIRADPTRLVPAFDEDLPEPDRYVMADFGIRLMLAHNFAEAVRTSAAGWVDDALAFSSPWGFEPADISVPTLLWHGDEDVFSPVDHSRWLGRQIPGARVVIQEGAAHFGALRVMPDVLTWLSAA
jgi:pimeloyl-ACP methyl ester carboxylesterase